MSADQIRVSFKLRGTDCLVKLAGQLTLVTEREFTARVAEPLAAFRGPVLFDLSGLDFTDGHGARALARALYPGHPRETTVRGCQPALRRVLEAFGLELPPAPAAGETPAALRTSATAALPGPAAALSPTQRVVAQAQLTRASARQATLRSSDLLSRLATTYATLALNSRYRKPQRSEDRGRLLALSGQAANWSRQSRLSAESTGAGPGAAPPRLDSPAR